MSAGRSVLVEIYVRMSGYAGKSGKARPLLYPHPLPGAKDLSEKASVGSEPRFPVGVGHSGPHWESGKAGHLLRARHADMVLM